MSKNAGPAVEELLRRIRMEGGTAMSSDFAMQLLSRCQRVVNAGMQCTITSTSFTTYKEQLLYNFRDVITDAIDITGIKVSNRTILKASSVNDLSAYSHTWFRDTGSRFEFWLQIGRELLVLYPALSSNSSVTVYYTKYAAEMDSFAAYQNTALELPDVYVDFAIGLGEVVGLLTAKRTDAAKKRVERLAEDFKRHIEGEGF